MFKSISFSILALVTCSVEAMTFNEPQEKPAVFQTIILKSDKTVFNNNFKNELTALPSDFSYDESSVNNSALKDEAFIFLEAYISV